jgi:hypothetical protein
VAAVAAMIGLLLLAAVQVTLRTSFGVARGPFGTGTGTGTGTGSAAPLHPRVIAIRGHDVVVSAVPLRAPDDLVDVALQPGGRANGAGVSAAGAGCGGLAMEGSRGKGRE